MDYLTALQKATNETTTENGGKAYASTLDPCLDFFALGAAKRENPEDAVILFKRAYLRDKITALRTLFYIRDIRGGQGERKIFRACMEELDAFDIENSQKVYEFIPEYGRWDDLLYHRAGNAKTVELVKKQLNKDLDSETPSLLAKYMPSLNASSSITRRAAINWCTALGMRKVEYRKMLSKLRKKIHLLEQDMSEKRWGEIQYDKLPSQAFRKHTKAFARNDNERYQNFIGKVNKGEKKINASTITTAEVLQNVSHGDDASANALWKSLDNFVPKGLNAIVVADVSGSMYGRPMQISTSLALYFAERNEGVFANKFLTFSESPELVEIAGDTLTQKLGSIETSKWGMNTNIEAVFDVLLKAAVGSQEFDHIPKVVYIISDMEFDECATGTDETVYEDARRKWATYGLTLPTIVFWNVDSRQNNVPVDKFNQNVVLISGSNQSTFRYALQRKSPLQLMHEVVNSERYQQIKV